MLPIKSYNKWNYIQLIFLGSVFVFFTVEVTGFLLYFLLLIIAVQISFQFVEINKNNRVSSNEKSFVNTISNLKQQLQISEKDKQLILGLIDEVVVYYDSEYTIRWASKSSENAGLIHDIHHKKGCCRIWNEQKSDCGSCVVKNAMEFRESGEGQIIGDDGRTWNVRVYPIFDDLDVFKGILEFSFDISRLKEAEKIIDHNQKELALLVEQRTIELADANHKLQKHSTERKNIETALFQNEYKFRSVVRNSPDGIMLTDETGIILEWNDSMHVISGLHRNDVLGRHFTDVQQEITSNIHTLDGDSRINQDTVNEILHKGFSERFDPTLLREIVLSNKRMGNRIVQFKIFTIPSQNGHKIAGIYRDVSMEKQKEQNLISSGQKLKTIFDNTFQAFILLGVDGKILEFNRVSLELGRQLFQKELVIGSTFEDYLNPVTQALYTDLFNRTLQGNDIHKEYEFVFDLNHNRWYEVHLAAVFADDRTIESVFLNLCKRSPD